MKLFVDDVQNVCVQWKVSHDECRLESTAEKIDWCLLGFRKGWKYEPEYMFDSEMVDEKV